MWEEPDRDSIRAADERGRLRRKPKGPENSSYRMWGSPTSHLSHPLTECDEKRNRPEIKVILASGLYSPELAGELCEAGPPIVKPYGSDAVAQRIRVLMAN